MPQSVAFISLWFGSSGAEAEIGAMATLRDQADERHAQLRVYKEMRDHKLANVFSFHFTFVQRTLAAVTGPTERLHLLLRRSSAPIPIAAL